MGMNWIERETVNRMHRTFGDLEHQTIERMRSYGGPRHIGAGEVTETEVSAETGFVIILTGGEP